MSFLKKNLNKFILLIPALFLAKPVFAWPPIKDIYSLPSANKFVLFVFMLGLVVVFETKIANKMFFKKTTYKDLLKIFLKANVISTIFVFLFFIMTLSIYSIDSYERLPDLLVLLSFLFSYAIEFLIIRIPLSRQYSIKSIKEGCFTVNIISFLSFYIVLLMLSMMSELFVCLITEGF